MSTKSAPRHGTVPALAVSGWSLRRKVALALTIPLLLAATLGGLRVRSALVEATNSSTSARQVTVLGPAVDYLVAAEQAMVAAHTASDPNLNAAFRALKGAAADLVEVRRSADLNADQSYQVDVVLDLSRALRESSIDSLSLGTWVAQLRQLQSGVTQLITTIVNAQLNPEPRLELLAQALGGRFSLAMQQALVATDRKGETASLELFAELGAEGAAIDRLASALGDTEPAVATLRTANAERFRTVRTKGTDLGGTGAYTQYDALAGDLLVGVDQELTASAADARTRALVNAGVTLAALLAAILLALLVSRLIINPIRRVREGALSVAHEELPAAISRLRAGEDPGRITPIDVTTKEEVGQLARAVEDLHRQAVLLASGEAQLRSQVSEMFVTLSRRNTALVNQQLALIETLEKDEEDPRRLESLFRLDHLASRMRRTGESLLILADAPSQFGGDEGLTVGDALQAATAGVQDYQRVRIETTNDLRLSDAASGDVVHLLTELVDNSLTYSAPSTQVTLTAVRTPSGVRIEVVDRGLGIPEDSLAELNNMLHSGGEVTPDTARRMGVFVVSRLSQRHGIAVVLRRNEHRGTTAAVLLPALILAEGQGLRAVLPPATTSPASDSLDIDSLRSRISSAMGRREPTANQRPEPAPWLPEREPVVADVVDLAAVRSESERPFEVAPVSEEELEPDLEPDLEPEVEPELEPASEVAPLAEAEPELAPEPVSEGASEVVQSLPRRAAAREWEARMDDAPRSNGAVTPGDLVSASDVVTDGDLVSASDVVTDDGLVSDGHRVSDSDLDLDNDTPIFQAMRSAWLSAGGPTQPWLSSEVEAGWEQADRVTAAAPAANAVGLPQRRPGTRLVPGGVTKPTALVARNPEAIKARLAAHAAGVSRGRHAAISTNGQEHREAGQA